MPANQLTRGAKAPAPRTPCAPETRETCEDGR